MQRLRRIVACLCSILIAAQVIAPFAYAAPEAPQQAITVLAASDVGCQNCPDRDGHRSGGCEKSRCAHIAGCCSAAAIVAAQLLPLHQGRSTVPPTVRPTSFVQPDPDTRLRPPTLLRG